MTEPENGDIVVEMRGVSRVFLTEEVETHALTDVSLVLRRGEYVAVTGPSGCGKSTLLGIMGLLDEPTRGSYRLDGEDVGRLSRRRRAQLRSRSIGFVFQGFHLIGDIDVFSNVELPLTYQGIPAPDRKRLVEAALDRVSMAHRARHFPAQLSGGQQQRVAVARAIVTEPKILLADEPTGNLDSGNGEAVMALLAELNRGMVTICMVTHDPRYAHHARRVVALFDGRVSGDSGGISMAEFGG